jgi:arylsulfatase A-like enzyme
MRLLARHLLPAAIAAAAVVLFEVLRELVVGATELGGVAQGIAFLAAVAGMLGLPLLVAGAALSLAAAGTRLGWRWGIGESPAPARIAGWVVFGVLVLVAVVLATQFGTIRFVRWFKKPVYQGLAAGLVAAGVLLVAAAVAGPAVGALTRGFERLRARVPAWADPTRPRAAALSIVGLLLLGALLAPVFLSELHTVDLRPARLALAWGIGLWALHHVLRRVRPLHGVIAAGVVTAVFAVGFGWSAGALGDSQARLVALDRGTLLAGAVGARVSALGDHDGDGVPRLFAGGDCNDDDPAIRPGVYDPPGDRLDQNCTGADLELASDPFRPRTRGAPGQRQDWHLVLVTIDALRADSLRAHMPNLRALAAESVDFRSAYCHGPTTYWALPALLASTMPSRVEMEKTKTPVAEELLLTETLRSADFHTALFANVTLFLVRGLRQGTHVADYETSRYTKHGMKPGSAYLTDRVLKHVARWKARELEPNRDQFFLWAHYYDPHFPYFEVPGFPAEDDSDRSRYEAIVRYTDREIGRLVAGLKQAGLWEKTLFVVTADHGEEFLDHGHRFHGTSLYEEVVHVPLLVRVPGVRPRAIDAPIGHLELAPTLLDLLGIRVPRSYRGRSRATEVLTGQAAPPEPVFFELFPDSNYDVHQVGMRLGHLKLIHDLRGHYYELYDLAADPGERRNLYDDHPQAPALRQTLLTYVDHHLYALGQGKSAAKLPPGSPPPPKKKK